VVVTVALALVVVALHQNCLILQRRNPGAVYLVQSGTCKSRQHHWSNLGDMAHIW